MIIGNPYKFSIILDIVKEWNIDSSFYNGILFFSINGDLFPKEVLTSTLKCEIPILVSRLKNITINNNIFNMQKKEAFLYLYNLTFPEDVNEENDYKYDISPQEFSDYDYFVFAVGNGKDNRILAAKLQYRINDSRYELKDINVNETFIDCKELCEIVLALEKCLDKMNGCS